MHELFNNKLISLKMGEDLQWRITLIDILTYFLLISTTSIFDYKASATEVASFIENKICGVDFLYVTTQIKCLEKCQHSVFSSKTIFPLCF